MQPCRRHHPAGINQHLFLRFFSFVHNNTMAGLQVAEQLAFGFNLKEINNHSFKKKALITQDLLKTLILRISSLLETILENHIGRSQHRHQTKFSDASCVNSRVVVGVECPIARKSHASKIGQCLFWTNSPTNTW